MKNKECTLHFLPAGQGDCFLIQFQDDNFDYHNILIDGGNRTTLDFKKQKNQLLKIIDNGKKGRFDLVVVTHSDDDHIKGILKLVADEEIEKFVDQYWFNSEKSISNLFGNDFKNTQKYPIVNDIKGAVNSSRQQDNDLYSILECSPKWNKEIITDQMIADVSGVKITVLSPSLTKLNALNNYWPTKSLKKGAVKSSSKNGFDYDLSIQELRKCLINFEQDNSHVNGASIAFLIEFHEFKWLFLSDSHPDVIVDNLNKLVVDNCKIKIDIVKLPHHGSKKNTNDALLNLIDCQNFVISANANKSHYHPNKETLVRVIEHVGIDMANFYFVNRNSDIEKIFSVDSNVNTHYPQSKEKGIVFNYEC
ncbi:MAG: ComEC/Rec2 family competence protein [Shewanella sp.]